MAGLKRMFHPRFGTVREVAAHEVDAWKNQGWRVSAPKGVGEHDDDTRSDRHAETPDPVEPPSSGDHDDAA